MFRTAYLAIVPAAGLGFLALAAAGLAYHPPPVAWLLLTGLTAVTGSYTVKIPGLVVRLSVSEPTVFLSTLLFGPAAGTITAAVDALVMSLRLVPRLRTTHRVLFNVGTVAIAVWPSAQLYYQLTGLDRWNPEYGALDAFVGPLYVFAASVFLINSALVAVALGLERGASAFSIWQKQFAWLSATYLASASVAAILVVFTNTIDFALVGLLLPLVIVSFLAIRTTLGRLDDANTHLSEVNQLYLSTIETLAMAIDAKDQVTHGHIRRVQRFAVGLAKELGLSDDSQLLAIEAAALLHDMGKLAIPEFILNKPGKLTAREFEVMKTHAALGADILSAIKFPYPVVPIVRYHHENWNGTGYPEGLRGSAIPLGARILSVVDCYDALTSDRPYRPAMSEQEAIEILTQRRGRMYDPLVVDTFISHHARLRQDVLSDDVPAVIMAGRMEHQPTLDHASTEHSAWQSTPFESLLLLATLAPFPRGLSANTICRQIVSRLRSIVPFTAAAVYITDDTTLCMEAVYAEGPSADLILQARIPVAEQLTGWVAAHRTAVWNSDAALDSSVVAAGSELVLASSIPLLARDTMVGVLTIYGEKSQEVTVAQRRALESLIPPLGLSLFEVPTSRQTAVDCRTLEFRVAGLEAFDSLLSHHRSSSARESSGVVMIVSLESVATDRRQNDTGPDDISLATLTARVIGDHVNRCCLVLTDRHLLIYAGDLSLPAELHREIETAMATGALHRFRASATVVSNSLELQAGIRRLVASDSDFAAARPAAPRVH